MFQKGHAPQQGKKKKHKGLSKDKKKAFKKATPVHEVENPTEDNSEGIEEPNDMPKRNKKMLMF